MCTLNTGLPPASVTVFRQSGDKTRDVRTSLRPSPMAHTLPGFRTSGDEAIPPVFCCVSWYTCTSLTCVRALVSAAQKQDALKREENLKEAKAIVISEDSSLPPAKKVCLVQ